MAEQKVDPATQIGATKHSILTDDEAQKHRLIDDGAPSSTKLWSSEKIESEIMGNAVGDVTLLKIDDYQADFYETVRCHPGYGGGNSFVVTLPQTNGIADVGKWVRVLIEDTTNNKFVTAVGFGGPNAAVIKKLGKKKIAYYKKVFQKYKKLKYFGDLINENSALEDPLLNMGFGFRLFNIEQSALLIWDGVQSWWITGTHGFGPVRGAEINVPDVAEFEHFVDIHNKGIVGLNPPTRQVDPVTGLFGAELFAVNDQIFISVPVHEYWRGHSVLEPDPDLTFQISVLNEDSDNNVGFELKAAGVTADETNLSTITPATIAGSVSASASIAKRIRFTNLKTALNDGGFEYNRSMFLLMRLKCNLLDGGNTGVNVLAASMQYIPRFPRTFLFTDSAKYE